MAIGLIKSFESMATLDGDGIRYAIFFCGCPLRCVYCHNPDMWDTQKALTFSASALHAKILRFRPYFVGGGGVTFSGGEPLLQADFIAELAPLLINDNINYALDTCGAVAITPSVVSCIAASELVILDLKFWDNASYKKYTGGDLDTVVAFGDYLATLNKRVWLRTVIAPNINDNEQILQKYAAIAKRWRNIEKYELLGFHTLGFSKYTALNLPNALADTPPLAPEKLIDLQNFLHTLIKKPSL